MERLQLMSFLASLVTVVDMQQFLQQAGSSICSNTVLHCTELYCVATYYTVL